MTANSSTGNLGKQLRLHRRAAALSQEELAERSKVSVRTISDLERGIRHTARLDTVRLLAAGLGLDADHRTALIAAATMGEVVDTPDSQRVFRSATLPRLPNALIGREQLVQSVVELLEQENTRIVTLTGPGGVGKTRVAIEVASRWSERCGGSVAFLSLASLNDSASVTSAIARGLDLPSASASPDDSVMSFLARQTAVLFVLDNFEHLLDASGLVARMAEKSTQAKFLVTSRSRLRLSVEREVVVPELDLPASGALPEVVMASGALQLFRQRAIAADPELEFGALTIDTAAGICRRLDGLPLAIELAASKLRVMSSDKLLFMLEKQLPVLTGGNRDQPARHQSMRETVRWSYDLLRTDHQLIYSWLAVYVGGFSLEAGDHTGRAIGDSSVESIEALETLVESGLVQRLHEPGKPLRFRMLETIREYGIEQLTKHGELDEVLMSFAQFIYQHVANGAPDPAGEVDSAWLARIEVEDANVIAAFDWLCSVGHAELAVRFCAEIGMYWQYQGPYRDGALRMRRAMSLASLEQSLTTTRALYWAAGLWMYSGDYATAREIGESAFRMAQGLRDRRAEAYSLHTLAWNAELAEQWSEARSLFEQALSVWKEIGEIGTQGQILMLLGGHAYIRGDYTSARKLEEAAAAIFTGRASNDWLASTEWYLGFIDVAEKQWHDAALRFSRSLELWLTVPSRTHHFKPIIALADVAAAVGDFEIAATLAGCCDHLLETSGAILFPFDKPAWERATEMSRVALGEARWSELHDAASTLGPSDWFELASIVVERSHSNSSITAAKNAREPLATSRD